ncbi:hypothetical protein GS917_24955 [Rhodococcus hoagii]|nr:hypothetical protein [Prescottella equi]MBM4710894.1 hypothetical protein [Prescottella equi]MBP0086122.1 hypothetical protein [Prescottella equi]NKV36894.1 hypothetical protein [Prescottella equi]NKV37898.1 hypothetical protein [Prescottella equi]
MKWIRAWLRKQIQPYQFDAWDEGFDYAWLLAEKYTGPIQYDNVPGEGYEANPYRGGDQP